MHRNTLEAQTARLACYVAEAMPPKPNTPEPWLRGTLVGVHPALAQVLYSLEQTKEDLEYWTHGLTPDQIWAEPHGLASVGFQLRHICGSIDRLLTYALGNQLSPEQMNAFKAEAERGASRDELIHDLRDRLDSAAAGIRAIDPSTLDQARKVGRKELPSTQIGLLIHIAEHTQRHVGQAIVTAKLSRALPA